MFIDFRYHVASLVAVFLALGMGILIGGVVLGNTAMQKQLGQIEEDLAKMRSDQRALAAEIAARDELIKTGDQFGAAVQPALIRDKLSGKRVALVRTNTTIDANVVKDLTRILKLSGAKVLSTTTVLRNPIELPVEKMTELAQDLGLSAEDPTVLARDIIRTAADRIAKGPAPDVPGSGTLLNKLAAAHLLEISGEYGGPVDIFILVGGSHDPEVDLSRTIDRVVLDTIAGTKGLIVAAVEPSDAARSYVNEYRQHPVVIVDNAETVIGQTALVLALVRGKKGHYGVKNAQQLMPEVL